MGNKLWDAHCHLQKPKFSDYHIDIAMRELDDHNIEGIINVFCHPTKKHYETGILLNKQYKKMYINFGLEPPKATQVTYDIFEHMVRKYHDDLTAIGEIGLDYYWDKDQKRRKIQQDIMVRCIDLANELNKSLVIHARDADDDVMKLLKKHANTDVLLHGFAGDEITIKEAIDREYYFTVPSSVAIRKHYQKITALIPLDLMMLETDTPYHLPFKPLKGSKRVKNTPKGVVEGAKMIALIKDTSFDDIAIITTKNTKKFFRI